MKTLTNRLMLFAAATVLSGTMAYGQTQMKAEIPFAFRTANATLPAGTYMLSRVQMAGVTNVMRLWNVTSHRSTVAMSMTIESLKPGERPSALFACGSEGCALREIRTSNGAYTYPALHKANGEKQLVSVIQVPITVAKGE